MWESGGGGLPDLQTMSEVRGDSELQSEILEDLREATNWRAWLCDLVRPHLGDDPLEIGSGVGDYGHELAAALPRFTVSEADPRRLALLRTRFADHPRVGVRELLAPILETGEHSAVVSFNVLEHISDDVGALASFAGLVRPGGRVVVVTPACQAAMSRFDREVGHVRRYSARSLRASAVAAGLDVVEIRHLNAPGLLAWFVMMKLLRGRPTAGAPLRLWDGRMIPLIRRLESRVPAPFGQTLVLVARVPAHA